MSVIQGDARSIPLDDGAAGIVICSPPYWGLRDYGTPGEIGAEPDPGAYVTAMGEVLAELGRVIRPDGNVFLVIGDKYARTGGIDRKARGIGAFGHDVWTIPTAGHRDPGGVPTPAVYPEDLVARVLRDWCPTGGLVLDPFAGSGTTGVVAARPAASGMDLSGDAVAAAHRRINARGGRPS